MGLRIVCRRLKRRDLIVLKLIAILGLCVLLYHCYVLATEHLFFYKHYITIVQSNPRIDTNKINCILPRLDPWDERAKKYIEKVAPVKCKQIQPYLTELTQDGILQWNRTEIQNSNLHILIPLLKCHYQEIIKSEDDRLNLLEMQVFGGSAQITNPFANISCTKDGYLYYHNIHAWMPTELIKKSTHLNRTLFPNIQIFVLDAVSQPNFIRQLPKTYAVLTEELSAVVFKGLLKVGTNTFPNLGAILTGAEVYGTSLPNHDKGFDSWPLIWKNFSKLGYMTIFGEDVPEYNAFNYLDSGFSEQPTDIYMRPFWLAIEDYYGPLYGQSSMHCFGNFPQHLILTDFLKRCTESSSTRPFFMMTDITQLSHNDLNVLQTLDDDLTNFFRWFHTASTNTILIVMGDHGINFGAFRATQLGRVESAFPFFAIRLPENLKKLYPHLDKNLRINSERMCSWYDVYDTLMDVATTRYDQPRRRWGKYGFSLFYPLPNERTCEGAGIPAQYCPCEIEIPLEVNSVESVKMAAEKLVEIVNKILSVEPRCPPLSLLTIKSAIKILPNSSTAKAKGFVNIYRIVIELAPSRALLEAMMKNDAWKTDFVVLGSITRLDKFGNSTRCVENKYLRNFCYCDKI